jgi:hypothetical protein
MGKFINSDLRLLRREFLTGLISLFGAFLLGRLLISIFAPKLQKSKYTKLPDDSIFSPEKPHNL